MKKQGQSDDQIVNTFVREDGIVTLASPPGQGLGPIVTWIGPGFALFLGFGVYSWFVRRNRKEPEKLMPEEQAVLDRFQAQIDRELDDSPIEWRTVEEMIIASALVLVLAALFYTLFVRDKMCPSRFRSLPFSI